MAQPKSGRKNRKNRSERSGSRKSGSKPKDTRMSSSMEE